MSILRGIIISILIAPLIILNNLFNLFRPKDNLLEWHLTYDQFVILIQSKYKEEQINDNLLITSYILFLSRYFYICDSRQIDVVRKTLHEQVISQDENLNKTAENLYLAVYNTLTSQQKKAVHRLYSMPPLKYVDDWKPMKPNTKYSFLVFEDNGILDENFHLSRSPDKILLPITVGILYEYVSSNFINANSRQKLNQVITDLLVAHSQFDCRSLKVFKELRLEILSRNNISY